MALLLALFIITVSSAFGAGESYSKTKKDSVKILALSPQADSYVPAPSEFCYYVKAKYTLQSLDRAFLMMNVYSLPSKGGKELLFSSEKIPVVRGSSTISLTSRLISLKSSDVTTKILFVISLLDSNGKEMAFSSSANLISGKLSVEKKSSVANSNYIQVLSVQPSPGAFLQTGIQGTFVFKFAYNIFSSKTGYALLRFSSMESLQSASPLREYFVPVPQGRGTLTVEIPELVLPSAKRGMVLGILIPFKASAGENDLSIDKVWPYCITK